MTFTVLQFVIGGGICFLLGILVGLLVADAKQPGPEETRRIAAQADILEAQTVEIKQRTESKKAAPKKAAPKKAAKKMTASEKDRVRAGRRPKAAKK